MYPSATFAILLTIGSLLNAADKSASAPNPIEHKLLGEWVGGPCMGEFTFRANGTFERRHYSPGNHTLQGTWQIQWQTSPPTLVIDCKESTNPSFVGWVLKVNLMRLDDKEFVCQKPGDNSTFRFERATAGTEKLP